MPSGTDVKNLILQFDASTELARREMVKFGATLDGFQNKTEKSLAGVEGSFSRLSKGVGILGSALGTLGVGVGVGAFVALGRGALQFADDLDAAAVQANINVERYQTLKESLRALEVDGDQADKAFRKLAETLGAVQGGTAAKGVTDALDKMGVTAKILSGEITTTDGLFDAIAGSAKTFKTEAQFTAAVVDILGGKIGVQLASAIRDGGGALKELEQGFKETGGVIDSEMIARLADANESIDKFTTRARSRFTIFFADAISGFNKLGAALGLYDKDRASIGGTTGNIGTRISSARLQVEAASKELNANKPQSRPTLLLPGALDPAIRRQELQNIIKDGNSEIRKLQAELAATASVSPVSVTTGAAPSNKKTLSRPAASVEKAGPSIASLVDELPKLANSFAGVSAGADKFFTKLENSSATVSEILSNTLEIDKTIVDIPVFDFPSSVVDGLQQANQFAGELSSNLADAIVHGGSIGGAVVGSLKSIAAQILSSGLEKLLGGIFGGLLGGIGGGIFGKIFGGAYADGGSPPLGKVSLVGERGPELFIPNQSGTIVPNGKFGGGGVVVNQTIAVNLAGNSATREDAAAFARIARDQAIAAFRASAVTGIVRV